MNETKRRGWIKNTVIIFLAILLILTLFSNTILNHSLPEVAVQYPQYATIASRIRQTGTVTANQSYDVSIEQTRTVASVEVRVGASVKKGDVIFKLEEGDSTELDQANKELANLNIQLIQKMKQDPSLNIGKTSSTADSLKKQLNTAYTTLNTAKSNLETAKEELALAEKELVKVEEMQGKIPSYDEVMSAKNLLSQIDVNIEFLEEEIARLKGKQGQIGGDGFFTPDEIENLIAEAEKKVKEKEQAYAYAALAYDRAASSQKKLETELKSANEALENAKDAVAEQNNNVGGSVSYKDLAAKQEAINKLKNQIADKKMYFTEAEYNAARNRYITAKNQFDNAYGKVSDAELKVYRDEMNAAAAILQPLEAKNAEIAALEQQMTTATQEYWQLYMQFSQSSQQNSILEKLTTAQKNAEEYVEQVTESVEAAKTAASEKKTAYETAEKDLENAKSELTKTQGYREYDTLGTSIKEMQKQADALKLQKTEAETVVQNASDDSKSKLESTILDKKKLVKAAEKAVTTAQNSVTDAQNNIADIQKQIKDEEAKAEINDQNAKLDLKQYEIELKQIQDQITAKQEQITRLEENRIAGTVVSPVSGVVESLAVSAGQEAKANTPIASIILSDMGYTMQCTVTAEQAAKVTVGETAEIQWYYYGKTPTARVVSIKNDPSSQGQNKIIVLDVTGDINPGTSLTFTLGSKNSSYECVVPNSAVREDANGKFVLVVTAKSTPLGNRYSAKRVDVDVLASDETNSAISGPVSGEYVITNSNSPISSGMNVRLSED
ncbi:MAG: HlyD family efflux transporter periplasmic adaptor subunit [Ruminococcaceae bacterium]|nr:HlyD family efflux transporter periplasmic adaptor subunit [Oscillospiraceae bacterium]